MGDAFSVPFILSWVYTVRISAGQRARVVDEVFYLVQKLLRDVNITVANTQYEHECKKKSSRLCRENNNVSQKIKRP